MCRWGHFELVDDIQSFLDVESQGFETWMYVYFTLLRNHVFRDDVEVGERFMHECCDIVGSLQNLGINVAIYEVEQLVKNFLNVGNLVQVCNDQRVLGHKLLFFLLKPLVKLIFDLQLLVFELFLEVKETLIDVFHLLELEPFQLLLYLFQ